MTKIQTARRKRPIKKRRAKMMAVVAECVDLLVVMAGKRT